MSSISCRALLIAAPASGQGKTTVTAALARHFVRQGRVVKVFKTGPDYIDPMILTRASGHPVHQLDLWMVGEEECRRRLREAAETADLILIEGVMGLFDGTPSSADLAERFGIPVLAVVDSKGMAQTFGAVAHGLATFRESLPFAGVLANRVASESHAEMLAESLKMAPSLASTHFTCLLKDEDIDLPSRHLGLMQAGEIDDLDHRLDRAADALRVPELEVLAPEVMFDEQPSRALPQLLNGVRVGVARDEAFSFIYPANVECLQQMGAELVFFSPLHDQALPEVDSLWLPGGYPELHAEQLAANSAMRTEIKAHFEAGKTILAECGGMLYINESLQMMAGDCYTMVGLMPGQGVMQKRLGGLGMQFVVLAEGEIRGHTFHYSRLETSLQLAAQGVKQRNGNAGEAVYSMNGVTASYLHFYFSSNPAVCASLLQPAERVN